MHPSDWNTFDWPLSARVRVVLRAADEAVMAKKLSPMNAGMLTMVVSAGMSIEEISDQLEVSTNAVYQQLRRVKKVLPEFVRRLDP